MLILSLYIIWQIYFIMINNTEVTDKFTELIVLLHPLSTLGYLIVLGVEFGQSEHLNSDYGKHIAYCYVAMVIQFLVFFSLVIMFDFRSINKFKGKDNRAATKERMQLDEGEDVLTQKNKVH